MTDFAGTTQMGQWLAAGDARPRSCRYLAGTAGMATKAIATDVDSPDFHRHRRPWGTS